jgi:hypothetical protein
MMCACADVPTSARGTIACDNPGMSETERGFGMPIGDHDSHQPDDPRVVVVGPGGIALSGGPDESDDDDGSVTDLVNQPAKVMRIGSMIRQLLEEVRAAPLDEAGRARLKEIHRSSLRELESGLAPELVDELERITLPFGDSDVPSESELRIAQAQLVGWLEGLFHGIQTTLVAQQMAARAQLEQMRRALPAGSTENAQQAQHRQAPGMYL